MIQVQEVPCQNIVTGKKEPSTYRVEIDKYDLDFTSRSEAEKVAADIRDAVRRERAR